MYGSISFHRIALVVALAVLGLAGPVSAVQAGKFHASGTIVSETIRGNDIEAAQIGQARPGGPFTGQFSGKVTGYTVEGVLTWDFGNGDTLTMDLVVEDHDHDGLYFGPYVITGGTGRF